MCTKLLPPAQLDAQLTLEVRLQESDVAEDPVAPYISTSCSSSPGECLGLVSAVRCRVPEFVRDGRVHACYQPAAFVSPQGKREGSREIVGFAFHNCLHNPGCRAHPVARPLSLGRSVMGSGRECLHSSPAALQSL